MAKQTRAGQRAESPVTHGLAGGPRRRARRAIRRAIFAGSFDPITNGHVDLVLRGQGLFDELVVAVGNNPAKRYWFTLDQRLALVREVVGGPNVEVVAFEGLLVEAARQHDAQVILRGLRTATDFEMEMKYAIANRELTGIETMLLPTDPAYGHVSSSLVREIATYGGDVARYVPPAVHAAMTGGDDDEAPARSRGRGLKLTASG